MGVCLFEGCVVVFYVCGVWVFWSEVVFDVYGYDVVFCDDVDDVSCFLGVVVDDYVVVVDVYEVGEC